jgi:multidrug efflux system membrane fusion protein
MKRLLVILVLLGATGGAYYWWHATHAETTQTAGRPGRGRRGGTDPETPVPVTAARAEIRNVPIYLDGLGTVQAFNLVNIKAMIDGPLTEVRFSEGQDVRAGDVLARIDPRPYQAALDAAAAKKQQDEATLANNRLDLARYTKLAPTLGSSQQQLDTARAQVVLQEALVRGDQAQIDTARTNLSYTTIQAPFDGRTGIRQVDVGNIVHASDATPLTAITQLKPISVLFTLPQQALGPVTAAMANGKPPVLALAGGGGGQVLDRGQLAVLDNQVDASTGTIKLKATFPNDQLKLWPGGFVNVRLLVDTARGATTVPTAAIQRGPRGPYVFIINPDTTVKRQSVTLGHEDEVTTIVTAGLQPGDQVVTDGAQRLNDNSHVAVAGPDGNAPDAVPMELRTPGTAQERSAPGTGQRRQRNAG